MIVYCFNKDLFFSSFFLKLNKHKINYHSFYLVFAKAASEALLLLLQYKQM